VKLEDVPLAGGFDPLLLGRMRADRHPGVLVAVEGGDGTGKTTLVRRLEAALVVRGYDVQRTRLPTPALRRTRLFQLHRRECGLGTVDCLALQVMHMADRLQNCTEMIGPALARGSVVLADRYVVSGIAALVNHGLPLDGWCRDLLGYMFRPDVGVYLHATWETRLERIQRRPAERLTGLPPKDRSCQVGMGVAAQLGMELVDTVTHDPQAVTSRVLARVSAVLDERLAG
jgi:dTMP kinase